jgi:hypothetical protein
MTPSELQEIIIIIKQCNKFDSSDFFTGTSHQCHSGSELVSEMSESPNKTDNS